MSTLNNINAVHTNANTDEDTKELMDFLASYDYDPEGNPRMVELEDGRCVSFQELEAMGEQNHE